MRARGTALVFLAALTACAPVRAVDAPGVLSLTVHPFRSDKTVAPLQEVHAAHIRAVIPDGWKARLLPHGRYPREGFIASPKINSWENRAGRVQGLEAFWVDVGKMGIPSDYYYMAARGPGLGPLGKSKTCRPAARTVFVDRPPDLTGVHFSPGDYVASATGICRTRSGSARWASVVAAPGFGPLREVGIPTSGLYVVVAVVSGPHSDRVLKRMFRSMRFGDASIPAMLKAARVKRG